MTDWQEWQNDQRAQLDTSHHFPGAERQVVGLCLSPECCKVDFPYWRKPNLFLANIRMDWYYFRDPIRYKVGTEVDSHTA